MDFRNLKRSKHILYTIVIPCTIAQTCNYEIKFTPKSFLHSTSLVPRPLHMNEIALYLGQLKISEKGPGNIYYADQLAILILGRGIMFDYQNSCVKVEV